MRYTFNKEQLKTLIIITTGAGHVFLGATVIPAVFGLSGEYPGLLLSGIMLTVGCWITSVILASGVRDD